MADYYTKYNADTGEIEYTFTGTADDAAINQPNILGEYKGSEYRIIDGVPVAKSQTEKDEAEKSRAWVELRNTRNEALLETDWTQGGDAPISDAKKEEYRLYRQSLRSLPENTTDPRNPTWPTKPS